jgi:hypothetical protein
MRLGVDYQSAISGIVRPFLDYRDGRLFIKQILPASSGLSTLDDPSASRRLVRVFSPVQVNTFALHRTAGFKKIVHHSAAAAFETDLVKYAHAEILHIGLTVLYGKQGFLPGTYLAMCLYIHHRTDSHPDCGSFRDRVADPRWGEATGRLLDVWAEAIREQDGFDRDAANTVAAEGFFTWLRDHYDIRSPKWGNARPDFIARFQRLAKLAPMMTVKNIVQKYGQNRSRRRRALLEAVRDVLEFPEEDVSLQAQTPDAVLSR